VVEAVLLPDVERHPGRVAQVLLDPGLEVAGVVAAPVALAPVALVAGQGVEALGVLDQLAEGEHEHAGPLAVDQQHADGLVLAQHRLELAHRGHLVDDHLAVDRDRQLDHLPQPEIGAGEDGHAPRPRAVDAAPHELPDAPEVRVHRLLTVGPHLGVAEQQVDLVLEVGVPGHPAPVDVDVARRDRRPLPFDRGQLPDRGLGDDGHGASCEGSDSIKGSGSC
jgi:hypothetical protein